MRALLALAGQCPQTPERTLGLAIVGLTVLTLGASMSVLIWAIALLD